MRTLARWMCSLWLACMVALPAGSVDVDYARVVPGIEIRWPADEGSHPEFRTEWWYVTGWFEDEAGIARGFQVTFFRTRPGTDEANPSAFAPKQLLFAHAALSDPHRQRLLRDEKAARAGFGLAAAHSGALEVFIDDWSLRSDSAEAGNYRTRVVSREFQFDLRLRTVQPPLLQGEGGFSQKQPDARFASYYYSLPQLEVSGQLFLKGAALQVRGSAWLDHEWSSEVMQRDSRGWDWIGINFANGGTLMAFQIRDLQGRKQWAAATWRGPALSTNAVVRTYRPEQIEWQALRRWRSPRTGVEYPVAWRVSVGEHVIELRPLMNDQESDARGSTGTLYWEGAVEAIDAHGGRVGRGYLELTGYAQPIRF